MNLFGFSGILIGVTSCALAIVVFLHNRRRSLNQVWALFAISVAIWGVGAYMISRVQAVEEALLWWRLTHIGIILIPVFFVHFVYIFLDITKRFGVYITYALGVFFLIANATPYFIFHMRYVFGQFYFDSPPGILYTPFVIFFGLAIMHTVYLLVRKYGEVPLLKQNQIQYFLWAIAVGFLGGSTSFLPVFQIDIYPVFNFTVALYPAIMSFAILKAGFFNIKVIATELLVIGLSIIIFVQIFFAVSQTDSILRSLLFVFILGMGTLLIRSVQKEVSQRERIEKLARELESSNKQLEAANERLKELDQLKSEFVSLATHQIRGPITAIKGYASMLLEGDFGSVPEVCKKPVETILQSSSSLAGIVQDFLDVSRIEQGKMKYELTDFDVGKLVADVAAELKPNIERKMLSLSLEIEPNIIVHADSGKLKQVFENLIDNAVKYTRAGSISVSLYSSKVERKVIFEVKDTGIGITQETLPHLFQKFSRAEDASKANIKGTGLGLYVARQLLEAQGGRIWAESEGAGAGAMFFVELPSA